MIQTIEDLRAGKEVMIDSIIHADCLEAMPFIKDKSINLILSDLPYGSTACHWDQIIPFEPLWKEYKRLIKDHGAIVLTASQPFATDLIVSGRDIFRYDLVWWKSLPTGHLNANKMPMRAHELVLVFYKSLPTYNPQKTTGHEPQHTVNASQRKNNCYGKFTQLDYGGKTDRFPLSVLNFNNIPGNSVARSDHGTQKPVALFEYLIKTYTNEGDLVLDNCIGSGTTAVACRNTNRHFIGIELSPEYCEIARKRIASISANLNQFFESQSNLIPISQSQ